MEMTLATLFDIQRFSIHDGPGIRTTLFFKGCPLRCKWCQNPESHRSHKEMAFFKEKCVACFACKDVCPKDAILKMEEIRIDFDRCDACGKCVSACPNRAVRCLGREWAAAPLLKEVMKDNDFFDDSHGGITLSGGEPTARTDFLKEFLPLVKGEGIHVNMETSGMFNWEKTAPLLSFMDMIFYDLKLMDKETHRRYTGVDNGIILENFRRLSPFFKGLTPRMPLIPTINDNARNIIQTAGFLRENNLPVIHLLPYNRLGIAKLSRLRSDFKPLDLPAGRKGYLLSAKSVFEDHGIDVILDD